MSEHSTPSSVDRQEIPRYPGEKPMPPRTPSNDEAALYIAKLAIQAKDRLKNKRNSKSKKTSDDCADQKQEEAQPVNVETDPQPEDPQIEAATIPGAQSCADSPHETSQSGQESTESPIPWPDMPFAYGDFSTLRLPLKSMYDGSGQWPKRTRHGGKKYSWSNIGFPRDDSLLVPDFEENTHIDKDEPYTMELATDVNNIRYKDPKEIADGAVESLQEKNRTIETFTVHGRTVCRVKFSDVNAFGKGSPYSLSTMSKSIEQKINEDFRVPPNLQIERWVMAHVLLSMGGEIGGRTDDYWSRARSLAQQQLYVNPGLEVEARQQMEAGDHEKDPAFSKMLALVKKGCPMKAYNLYHQAQRNDYATENGLLYKVENTDIILVLDQSDNMILFQCGDVFKQLLTKAVQKLAAQSFETYSTLTPIPWPDMTRHGLHWISFLSERPDLDFRNQDNDPRLAKSGVFHIGARCEIGDPDGQKLPGPTKDNAGRRVSLRGHVFHQLVKLRYSAFGACTEMSKFFFQILEPTLMQQYIRVADEVAKLGVPFQTRRSGEPFSMRALLVNLMTYEHQDTGDWHHGYAFLLPVGDFTGGDLVLRELGLQIEAPSGCLQMLRGRELRHSITKWSGRRFVCVNVTHESVRRWALRSLGEEVNEEKTSRTHSILSDCIDKEPEDVVPEDQREEEMSHWLPESEDELGESVHGGSEASLPSEPERERPSKSKHRAASSSDASAEASDQNAGNAKRQKKA
ncbi:hypothetical protein INS49_004227 [Diaporthe citri]|uniref:uncharacterized protein n=1 Tax=Diaporthe citri TaxID=83186 RepID=UPI001C7F086D|nr:uncharacterized protein INS49_004227 [Diaporthe citri]KAG6355146.1 hypothetical protein INS49_004227 [Diaporthe citri]